MKPKLRSVQPHLVEHQGRPGILLRDPFALTDCTIVLPPPLAPLLELCDGTRDEAALRAALEVRAGVRLTPGAMAQVLAQLDEALLLDNERYMAAHAARLAAFRQAPYRPYVCAGNSYPADVQELTRQIHRCIEVAHQGGQGGSVFHPAEVRGLISPHIDYARGGLVYGAVWSVAAAALPAAELVIIFGTDHGGGEGRFTLTRQHYATPWGVLPTAQRVVEAVAEAIGEEAAFGEELNHSSEHSIELAAIWLHYLLGERQLELVPILCGSFQRFVAQDISPEEDETLSRALEALRTATAPYRTLVVAAADLAHVGPAFGDVYPVDWVGQAQVRAADERLLEMVCAGDARRFFGEIQREGDRRQICGLPPIYLMLRFLGQSRGTVVSYAQCPADNQHTSWVSVCGVILE
jgi:AmmeMemoRadiSam system protein B